MRRLPLVQHGLELAGDGPLVGCGADAMNGRSPRDQDQLFARLSAELSYKCRVRWPAEVVIVGEAEVVEGHVRRHIAFGLGVAPDRVSHMWANEHHVRLGHQVKRLKACGLLVEEARNAFDCRQAQQDADSQDDQVDPPRGLQVLRHDIKGCISGAARRSRKWFKTIRCMSLG